MKRVINWFEKRLDVVIEPLLEHRVVREVTQLMVLGYYAVAVVVSYSFLINPLQDKPNFEPFWPVAWVNWLELSGYDTVVLMKVCFIATAFLSVIFHRHRAMRILFFLVIWQLHAVESSFGAFSRQWYTWLFTSGILMFLPDIWSKDSGRLELKKALIVLWGSQAFIMLTYTMAGVHKVYWAIKQYLAGEVHGFARDAFLYQIAWWLPRLQKPAYLATYIQDYPYLAWVAYVSVHYFQFFALWAMFRTSLLPLWTLVLLAQHVLIYLTMGIVFAEHFYLTTVLFLISPFVLLRNYSLKEQLQDLPLFGYAFKQKRVKKFLGW